MSIGTGSYIPENINEPGYESLPDNRTLSKCDSQDPGYEVVTDSKLLKTRQAVHRTSSEYDPNYEVLRPTISDKGGQSSDDGYAKVLETNTVPANTCSAATLSSAHESNDNDMIDGYSSIDPNKRANLIIGYSEVGQKNNSTAKNHDYASIKETQVSSIKNLNNNDDDEGSDIYSSIPSTTDTTQFQYQYSNTSTNLLTENSPGYSSISEARTTPSTEGYNSSELHINSDLGHFNSQSTLATNTLTTHRYESLTESESDPNYESVKYVNAKENPYERLHNEKSLELQLASSTAATTPSSLSDVKSISTDGSSTGGGTLISPSGISSKSKSTSENLEVGDYFQV